MKKTNQTNLINAFYQKIVGSNQEPMTMIQNIIKDYELNCEATDLVMAYNVLSEISMLHPNDKKKWNQKLEKVLLNFVTAFEPIVKKKMMIYEAFDALVGKKTTQTHYSKLTRQSKKEQPIHNLTVDNGQVEHISPVSTPIVSEQTEDVQVEVVETKETPRLLTSLTETLDVLEENGQNPEEFFATISEAVHNALTTKEQEVDKQLRIQNRKLVSDLEVALFQIEQLTECLEILNKKMEQKDNKIMQLEADLYNAKSMLRTSDVESIRALNKLKVVLNGDGTVEKVVKAI